MPLTNAPLVLPRPTSLYRGLVEEQWGLVRTGRLRRAATALAALDPMRLDVEDRARVLGLLMSCRLGIGDLTSAGLTDYELIGIESTTDITAVISRLARGELASAQGRYDEALLHFMAASESVLADDPDLVPWRAGAVTALVRTGRRAEAMAMAHDQLLEAEDSAAPHRIALALRTLSTADPEADVVTTLTRALGLADHGCDLRLLAQLRADLAGLLLFMPDADSIDARAMLREAESFAASEGLWPLHNRISRLLDRAGEAPAPLGQETLASLTNAERRVAQLASQGLSNRQIAEQLAVTVKGVEWHLSRVYRKLGIESRAGLARILDEPASQLA